MAPLRQIVHHQGHRPLRVRHSPPLLQASKHQQLHQTSNFISYPSSICTASTSPEKNPPKISSPIPTSSKANPISSSTSEGNSNKTKMIKIPQLPPRSKSTKTNPSPKKSSPSNQSKPKTPFYPPKNSYAPGNTLTLILRNEKKNSKRPP